MCVCVSRDGELLVEVLHCELRLLRGVVLHHRMVTLAIRVREGIVCFLGGGWEGSCRGLEGA